MSLYKFFLSLFVIALMSSLSYGQSKVIFIGDSLTEGYGLDKEFSYPSIVQKLMIMDNLTHKVINGGISGSTTASGLSRLKWFLKASPQVLVIALGANDALRGIKVTETRKNLEKLIELAQKNKLKVLLAAIKVPPNYGEAYGASFDKMFTELSNKYKIAFMPFLLKGVAGRVELNQPDGIHPNKEGHSIMAKNIYPYLKELL